MRPHYRLPVFVAAAFAATLGVARAQDAPPAEEKPAADESAATTTSPRVKLATSKGDIVLELNAEAAPISTENFLSYVKSGFYDNTVFHRVIDDFMIQGGGFGKTDAGEIAQKETGKPIKNEAQNELKNERGTIAMARTGDPDSATSQFFINVTDNTGLDYPRPDGHGYAVFGKVVEGMDVVDAIKEAETEMRTLKSRIPSGDLIDTPMQNVPVENVVIKEAKVVGSAEAEAAPDQPATEPADAPDAPDAPGVTDPAPADEEAPAAPAEEEAPAADQQ